MYSQLVIVRFRGIKSIWIEKLRFWTNKKRAHLVICLVFFPSVAKRKKKPVQPLTHIPLIIKKLTERRKKTDTAFNVFGTGNGATRISITQLAHSCYHVNFGAFVISFLLLLPLLLFSIYVCFSFFPHIRILATFIFVRHNDQVSSYCKYYFIHMDKCLCFHDLHSKILMIKCCYSNCV